MRVKIVKDYKAISEAAADVVEAALKGKPDLVLGLATGSTPLGMYEELIKRHQGGMDFSKATTFNLDEYFGLSSDHQASYHYYMEEQLFRHINIDPANTYIPNGINPDPMEECKNYETQMKTAGGIDLQILGIGTNGHIGFNEPGAPFGGTTSLVDLAQETVNANARFFQKLDEVPRQAISMGIKSIMNCAEIVLLANGAHKADAVSQALLGPVTEKLPASVLQLHPNCLFIIDEAAAAKLPIT
ncbi:MAG: glucosamine-6-phosphate deaminase [Firmicutes bacterium]|nr:glucosamine-6-phosphate deaminase [Bacillota bacterium]